MKKKRSKKSHRDTCGCVPDPATLLRIIIYPLWGILTRYALRMTW